MDIAAEFNSEKPSSAPAEAADCASAEAIGAEVRSELAPAPVSESDASRQDAAGPADGKDTNARGLNGELELLPFFSSRPNSPILGVEAAKPAHNFATAGLKAGLALILLAGAGVVGAGFAYEHFHQTSVMAAKVRENEHLVSTVSNLTERLDTIEATRVREENADIRKVLGEIKQSASATRDVTSAVAQLAARVDRVEHEQSGRLDKLTERLDHDATSHLTDLAARVDKLEKKAASPVVASAPTPPPKPGPEVSAAIAQLSSRLDHIEHDQGERLEKLGERIEHDSSARFAELAARMDKQEKSSTSQALASTAPAPSKAAPASARPDTMVSNETTGSIEKPKLPLRGYAVVGVGEGFAVIEGRQGSVQVGPGDMIPGVGRVLRIERHGREWQVVTSQGVIAGEAAPY